MTVVIPMAFAFFREPSGELSRFEVVFLSTFGIVVSTVDSREAELEPMRGVGVLETGFTTAMGLALAAPTPKKTPFPRLLAGLPRVIGVLTGEEADAVGLTIAGVGSVAAATLAVVGADVATSNFHRPTMPSSRST